MDSVVYTWVNNSLFVPNPNMKYAQAMFLVPFLKLYTGPQHQVTFNLGEKLTMSYPYQKDGCKYITLCIYFVHFSLIHACAQRA